ncbi:LamG-like jellyroll fold domain-containing protein [Nocardioides sp. NPDC000445]|uniref:LamG-like jellyroll fold domain-containing protein n=1 Tax=Nocardioides sp. NPDC000445 TaxID=3154257 RepID=UPI00332F1332
MFAPTSASFARPGRRRLVAVAAGLALAGGVIAALPGDAVISASASTYTAVGAPLTGPPRAALATVDVPAPDVLDIDFEGGAPHERAQSLEPRTWGAPTYGTDDTLAETPTDVMTVDGTDDAVSVEHDPWAGLQQGFTIECVFRVETTLPTSNEKDLCSNKEAGGYSVYVTGSNLGTMAHIGGGYKTVLTPITAHRWYHVLSVWDGQRLNLYVNGTKAGSTAATGALQAPAATSRRFVVGADSAPTGIGQPAPPASFAAASLFARAVTDAEAAALAGEYDTAPPVPAADVLDVDFDDGTPADDTGRAVTTVGEPVISDDTALDAKVASFDGSNDAYAYAMGSAAWDQIDDQVSIECTFKDNGTFPNGTEHSICSEKEGGGYSIVVYSGKLTFAVHAGGAYRNAQVEIETGRWYHAVGTWDGSTARLYVDGALAASIAAPAPLTRPGGNALNSFYVGADSVNQFWSPVTVRTARIFTDVLTADEANALSVAALGDVRDAGVVVNGTTPAAGSHITTPTEFAVDITNQGNASGWTYALDGDPIRPGQEIGAGLARGEHTIEIAAKDVFGRPVAHTSTFTSDAIPTGGGTDTGQGKGKVTLSAIANSPDGSDVTTTFKAASASVADGGFQGVVPVLPSALEFDYSSPETIDGSQKPDGQTTASTSSKLIPFQRYDVSVPASDSRRHVVWTGTADPARSVSLRVWNTVENRWDELASARGIADGDTTLQGRALAAHVDDGVVHVLVTGIDPFADDLSPRDESAAADKDHFENPDDYDFSFAHFTDTQYIAEGAAGGTYENFNGIEEPSDVQLVEEQAVWQRAYRAETEWIRDNADQRKIAFTSHTGDVTENDTKDPLATDANGNLLYPGLDEQITREFEFTSDAQGILDEAGVVNQVVAGNHDNQGGRETGSQSRFSRYFSPSRYYDAAQGWPEGASYHAWDEVTDGSGNVVTPGTDNQNNYVLFSAGGLDFVAVGLSYGVTPEEAAWASEIFARFPDRNGILSTHAYLAPSSAPDGRGANFSTDGSRLFDQVVEANPNVFLVLAGHEHGVGTNLKRGIGATVSHNVVELLADYQFYKVTAGELFPDSVDAAGNIDLNGDGTVDHKATDLLQFGASYLRLLQFDTERSEMSIDTYSPHLDDFGATEYDDRHRYNGAEDNLTLPVDLSTRRTSFTTDALTVVTPTDTVIGTDTARSGWPATVEWAGLTEGQVYAWTSTSRTGEAQTLGSIDQFGGVFLATAAGTDATPPVLTVPASTTIEVGAEFDPLDGVSATDNTDGDLTSAIQVSGSVDTTKAGAYPLTYTVTDSNGNQAVASRAVVVEEPNVPELTPVTLTAKDVTVRFGRDLVLRTSVAPRSATGTVQFLIGEDVLCEARVRRGVAECEVDVLPPPGRHQVQVFYPGDDTHAPATTNLTLTVRQRQ